MRMRHKPAFWAFAMQTETTPKTEVNAMLEVTAAQMKELERKANETGLSYEDMMENAGQAAARILLEQLPGLRTAAVVCGKGNNGGRWLCGGAQIVRSRLLCAPLSCGRRAHCAGRGPHQLPAHAEAGASHLRAGRGR